MVNLEDLGITKDAVLDQTADRLAHLLQESLYIEVKNKVFNTLEMDIKKAVNDSIQKKIDECLTLEYQPVNSWGKPTGKKTTVTEVIEDSFVNWWSVKVDRAGRPSSGYNAEGTRAEYMTKKLVEETISSTLKNDFDSVLKTAKNELKNALTKAIKQIVEKNLR